MTGLPWIIFHLKRNVLNLENWLLTIVYVSSVAVFCELELLMYPQPVPKPPLDHVGIMMLFSSSPPVHKNILLFALLCDVIFNSIVVSSFLI